MKVNFIRKPTPEELKPQDNFIIEKRIEVTDDEFGVFEKQPLDHYDFIRDNVDSMYRDSDEVWHCILITCPSKEYGYLIESEGYSYGRYVAFLEKAKQN